ncbi:histidine kinase dimerization/phosphoacceptor domain -containing protein [Mucilaginibacter gossypii]|uniref:tetratricopeptide repeat-containing sensor histidine kinase n=1 Tax=Mucilaginibacter gossypii TaxID=551996 RepID=UPI000DCD7C68|nr:MULTISPECIES: histidine kinase dimerization/phosphoacceptor domain -containing protein [Mucilaginibacter]QTE39649.1 histidine kinase dimerization/phosphoacceptor domain -containing protein [Mucilaginibacter gossypii]RAV54027.1 hypothetical protein DIU36_22070 [Mucilaginibacter rubeus]
MAARSKNTILKFLFFAGMLLAIVSPCFSQQNNLLKKLHDSKPDTAQLKILHELGNYYLKKQYQKKKSDLDSAKYFFTKELELSNALNDTSRYGKYESLGKLGEVSFAKGNKDQADAYFVKIINHYQDIHDLYNQAVILQWFGEKETNASEKIEILKKALEIFQKLKMPARIIDVNLEIAGGYVSLNKLDTAQQICKKVVSQYKNANDLQLDQVYRLLASVNRYQGNLNQSLFYILKSVKISESKGKASESTYGELAQIYQDLGETEKSIYYYKKTIELREKGNNVPQEYIFRTAGFVVQGLIKLKQPREALNYIEYMERRHPHDSKFMAAVIEQIKANCYEALNEPTMAEKNYLAMMRDYNEGGINTEIIELAKYDIARFYIHQKKYTKAAYFSKGGITINSIPRARDFELLFFQIDSALRNFPSAINHFKRYKALSDSIFNEATSKQIAELQIKYETDQKEKDIKLLTKSNQIKDNIARQANTSRNVALGGSAAVVLFMVLFYYNYRLKQKTNNEIREKNDALNQLVKDKEWLIKEIHHRVKNNLQIVIGLLQRQSSFVDNAEALAIIQNSEHRMQSIALIHQKLYQSDDLALIDMADYIDGFVSYLKEYLDPQSRIIFLREVDAIQLDVAQAVPVGLILNEAITNSIKYAFPEDGYGTINITLTETCENSYLLIIADNGRGLEPGFNIEECRSLGMKLIKGLSKQLNGKLQIISEKGLCLKISFKTDAVLMGG